MTRPTISFEFFPPKTDASRAAFYKEVEQLATMKPDFMTVTYGAGGSTKAWTMETAVRIQKETGIPTAVHLTCVNTFKDDIDKILDEIWNQGIRHVIALRGDVPQEDKPLDYSDINYYHYANELIDGIHVRHDFEISVAAYPEKHPECPTVEEDIRNLARKCQSGNGVARAITQFFFDNECYYDFCKKAKEAGIDTPIVPGLLPVANFEKMLKFAQTCQTNVPSWLNEKFSGLEPGSEEAQELAVRILAEQIKDLMKNGVEHIHFYTLNKADLTMRACDLAGLRL